MEALLELCLWFQIPMGHPTRHCEEALCALGADVAIQSHEAAALDCRAPFGRSQ